MIGFDAVGEASIKDINKQAIKDGFMVRGRRSRGTNNHESLGEELTKAERKMYQTLYDSYNGVPVGMKELTKKHFKVGEEDYRKHYQYTGILIQRIREKLGYSAIITCDDGGYIARSAMIDKQVKKARVFRFVNTIRYNLKMFFRSFDEVAD